VKVPTVGGGIGNVHKHPNLRVLPGKATRTLKGPSHIFGVIIPAFGVKIPKDALNLVGGRKIHAMVTDGVSVISVGDKRHLHTGGWVTCEG
jgi:hypothetical protein